MHSVDLQLQEKMVRRYHAHRTMLEGYIRLYVRDPLLAEQTTADVQVALLQSADRYDESRPFEPWARAIAFRICMPVRQKHQHQTECLDHLTAEAAVADIDLAGPETELERRSEALHRCMAHLQTQHRELLEYRFWSGFGYARIAALMGKSVAALQVTFKRLRRVLGDCVRRQLDAE